MKIFSIIILHKSEANEAKILKCSNDLSNFGYFQRSTINEFMKFTSKLIVERTLPEYRASVKQQEYIAHYNVRYDNLSCVLISDEEYPKRVAHTLINKILDDFSHDIPKNLWLKLQEE
jgi:synaptobrevin family protein YKT6